MLMLYHMYMYFNSFSFFFRVQRSVLLSSVLYEIYVCVSSSVDIFVLLFVSCFQNKIYVEANHPTTTVKTTTTTTITAVAKIEQYFTAHG